MSNHNFKIDDKVRILSGMYAGKDGQVEAISDTKYCIGVRFPGNPIVIWFEPDYCSHIVLEKGTI